MIIGMLAVSSLRDTYKDENQGGEAMETSNHINFSINGGDGFPDFADCIDFDDLFIGINVDGDVLPDLEMDPEILADFSAEDYNSDDMNTSPLSAEKSADIDDNNVSSINSAITSTTTTTTTTTHAEEEDNNNNNNRKIKSTTAETEDDKDSGSGSGSVTGGDVASANNNKEASDNKGGKKSSSSTTAQSKNNNSQGKRKVKVDWTPELHRRFVQAVEQLGVDKAVPSRILELMGIDCLTRHNIASHLQKYRSHRKHLLAREAEAASWSQRRQMFGAAPGGGGGAVAGKRDVSPWAVAPTMGFPQQAVVPQPPPVPMHPHFRPLHVWGHPTVDQSLMHVWPPKHLPHSPSHPPPPPPPAWQPAVPTPPPLHDPSYWHSHPHRVPSALTPGTPCFPQPMATPRFSTPAVPGIPPGHAMYKVDAGIGNLTPGQSGPHPLFDFHPSKESVDEAIGDVLAKPWLPLPLGLKPPSMDSVMGELQRQGVPKIPPSCA
ncbi:hypothetical protein CsatA_016587 [Cannabis sativa]